MASVSVAVRTSDLAREIAAYLEQPGRTLIALAGLSGVNVRTLRGILSGRYHTTTIWTADKVMTALGTHYAFLETVEDGRKAVPASARQRRSQCVRPAQASGRGNRSDARRVLAPAARVAERKPKPKRSRIQLQDLVEAGLVGEGTFLYASLSARDAAEERSFRAIVTGKGEVRIDCDGGDGSLNGVVFPTPSAAITALYGRPDGGWKNWWLEHQGCKVRLEHVRDLLEQRQRAQQPLAA